MEILNRTIVSNWQNCPVNTSQAFPGIAVTSSGRIIVSWRSAPLKEEMAGQCVMFSTSDDGGKTWSEPKDVFTPPEIDGKAGRFRAGFPSWVNNKLYMLLCWVDDSIPGRPFFKEENQGLLDCRIFWSESTDNGDSWNVPKYIDTAPFDCFSTPVTGPILGFSNGEIFAQFELNNSYDAAEKWRHLPVFKFSADNGRTFVRHTVPAADPANNIFFWDQRPLVLKNDTVVDFFWTWDNASNTYFNIHTVRSLDHGQTWTSPADTNVSGQPGQPVEFADGTLLLPLVDRTEEPKIMARISHDLGKTFTGEALEICGSVSKKQTAEQDNVNGAWNEMGKFSLGLPAGTVSDHNTAYIVWYAGQHTDRTNIEFAEVGL